MCGLRVFCLNILLSFLPVSGSLDVPENGQDKDSLIVLMLSKMQVMQDKIDMLEKSDREMKQRFADVTAKFQSEIDELNIQIQSFKSKLKSENTENESGIEKDVGHGDRLIQSEIYENDKETMQTRRKIGKAISKTIMIFSNIRNTQDGRKNHRSRVSSFYKHNRPSENV